MKTCDLHDLAPIPEGQERRVLAAMMTSSPESEEPGDTIEMLDAFLNLGRARLARRRAEEAEAEARATLGAFGPSGR